MTSGAINRPPEFFVSRAGPDAAIATTIAHILEAAGRTVIIQDWDFKNRAFMERMHTALCCGARTIALLSPDYLTRDHCTAEWQSTIADDPLNKTGRLIVLRIKPCVPLGLLRSLTYWDLVPVLAGLPATEGTLRDVVLAAVQPGRQKSFPSDLSNLFRESQPVLHPEITSTPNFTGRDEQLFALERALSGANAQPAVVHGFGGIGKSTLAREYAWRASKEKTYTGVWWLNAAKVPDTGTFDDIEHGLVGLRSLLYPGTGEHEDRAQAARDTLAFLSAHGAERPWLLIYDNVDDQSVLPAWSPPANVRVLMTSRIANWRSEVSRVDLDEWTMPQAVTYLRKESGRADLTETNAECIAGELGRLPLALSHAAAYLRDVDNATPESYLAALSQHLKDSPDSADYTRAVFTTLMENIRQAEVRAPGAGAVLSLASFFAPDYIPEELYGQSAAHYPLALRAIVGNPVAIEKAIGALARLSLIKFRSEDRSFSLHPLVQAAARDALGAEQAAWAGSAVVVVNAAFPSVEFANWRTCERLTPHARAAARHAGDTVGEPLALLLNNVAYYFNQRAACVEAEPLSQRALAIREKVLGPDHPEVGISLNNLAALYRAQGKYDLAEPLYRRSIAIAEKTLGSDHPRVGDVLSNLADLYQAQGKYDLAVPLSQRALAIHEKALGSDDLHVGTSLNNLAEHYRAQSKYDLAEPLYQRALAILEKGLSPDHPDVGTLLDNLAQLYRTQGKYDLAEPLYQRAVAILEKTLGPDHPDVGSALDNLAELYHTQDKFDLAEPLYQRAIAIGEKALGPDHPDIGTALNNLAALHRAQDKYGLAEPLCQRALAIREKALGPDHPEVGTSLNNLAALYGAQGKYDLAEPLYRRAIAIREKALGPDHPQTALVLANLAYELAKMRRLADAERLARRAHRVLDSAFGGEHPDTKKVASILVTIEDALKRGSG
jgi:tetratricopeptide (TPR) repeat protein